MRADPLVLAFDTSAAHCAAALVRGPAILARRDEAMDRGQAERLLPMLEEMLAEAGVAWRDLHDHFGKWSSVYRQFRRWTLSGLWELLLEAFNNSGGGNPSLQMIDSTIIRAHQCSAGAKGGLRVRVLAAQKVALRPRSISASMRWACP